MQDFIVEFENFFSREECKEYVELFDGLNKSGFVERRIDLESHKRHEKDDLNTGLHSEIVVKLGHGTDYAQKFMSRFWNSVYPVYSKEYSILNTCHKHGIYALKIQKTYPGNGYHIWHFENSDRSIIDRLLTFILYLNDVDEGGETEFLYYPRRIKPKTGKLILFPGSFTHSHRGNQPLSGEKYIITGWVEYL